MNRCVVVDGTNVMYRSYFAMANSNLSANSSPSGALFGTIVALRTYLRELQPTHMVWFFDNGKSALRLGMREDYKGHRKYSAVEVASDPATDIPPQLEAFEDFLDTLGIKHYDERGVEADDLIAQVAHRWDAEGCELVIVSGDHDMLQLVNDHVLVFRPGEQGGNGGSKGLKNRVNGRLYHRRDVVEKYGLEPEQLAQMWALTGDVGDNIIGIPGVGPKTAAKWIVKHGSLQKTLSAEPKCEGFERQCYVNWQMINLDGSVGNVAFDMSDCQVVPPDRAARYRALDFLREWEMRTVAEDFGSGEPW